MRTFESAHPNENKFELLAMAPDIIVVGRLLTMPTMLPDSQS